MQTYTVRPDAYSYGHDIGILLLDCRTPFIPGDVGNASSYAYPVLYQPMPGVTLDRLINDGDMSMAAAVIAAAQTLAAHGVRAITSDCGYMLYFQDMVADSVEIPVMLSSLLQLPFIASTLGKTQAVGVICANRARLTDALLQPLLARVERPVHIIGLEGSRAFKGPILDETPVLDSRAIGDHVVAQAQVLRAQHPDIGAWLLECSNLPPYAHRLQQATGLPVYDFITMIDYVRAATRRRAFDGYY